MDDERLKNEGGGSYFEELLERIRDIRSSEKVFWCKILDIYATSIDYNPHSELSKFFFDQVQNKMHWAAHGHTAAEIINGRADAPAENMGMTNWPGGRIRKSDVGVAKNYLTEEELRLLNRIVTAYLETAELQALNRVPMHMADWIQRLDGFLTMTGRDLLDNAGTVSHEKALEKARNEYDIYRLERANEVSPVEKHFLETASKITKIDDIREKEGKR